MASHEDLLITILERIRNGIQTEEDIATLRQSLSMAGNVLQSTSQDGKLNNNIGQIAGGEVQYGDRTYYGTDAEVIEKVLLKILPQQNQKPLTPLTGADGLGKLSNVPELPANYLPRPDDLDYLKKLVLSTTEPAVVVTGKTHKVGVQGMAGIGKTVLASALARDKAVQKQFSNGIVWVILGQEPQLLVRQAQVVRALTRPVRNMILVQKNGRK